METPYAKHYTSRIATAEEGSNIVDSAHPKENQMFTLGREK
jgi:hypothetical protein